MHVWYIFMIFILCTLQHVLCNLYFVKHTQCVEVLKLLKFCSFWYAFFISFNALSTDLFSLCHSCISILFFLQLFVIILHFSSVSSSLPGSSLRWRTLSDGGRSLTKRAMPSRRAMPNLSDGQMAPCPFISELRSSMYTSSLCRWGHWSLWLRTRN